MEKILNQASKDLLYSSQMWKPFQYGASLQGGVSGGRPQGQEGSASLTEQKLSSASMEDTVKMPDPCRAGLITMMDFINSERWVIKDAELSRLTDVLVVAEDGHMPTSALPISSAALGHSQTWWASEPPGGLLKCRLPASGLSSNSVTDVGTEHLLVWQAQAGAAGPAMAL